MKGLFVNGQKIADIEKDSVVEVRPRTINISNGKQHISADSIGAVIGVANNDVSISGAKVIVDDFEYTLSDFTNDEVIKVEIYGDCDELKTNSGDVTLNGNVNSIKTQSGDIDIIGEVNGDIKTMSGDVKVKGNVHGKVSTMSGDIKHN